MNFFKLKFKKIKKPEGPGIGCKEICGVVYGSPIPQFVIGADHKVIYWNKALAEYSGIKGEDIIGTNQQWRAFYDRERPCLADLLADQKIDAISELYKGKYGKSKLVDEAYEATDFFPEMGEKGRWLYFTAAPVRDAKGVIIGAVETLEDITDRKEFEESLEKQKARLQKSKKALINAVKQLDAETEKLGKEKAKDEAILMSIGDGLVITDINGKVALANSVFENMIGWQLREMLGRSLFDVMPCQDEKGNAIPPEKRFVSRVLEGEKPVTTVFYYVAKDGSRFPGAVTVRDIEFNGSRIGSVSVLRDVTRETEIDRAKSEFISLASHQLRDAPTVISWTAESLLNGSQGELDGKQREYVEEIYQRNKSAIGLINDLLNVSRIDLGTFAIETAPVSLKDICANELKQFAPIIKEKRLKIEEAYDDKIPLIEADAQLVQIIFQNLISNAVHYTPEGGKITVGLSFGNGDEKNIVFTVSDNGCGIPQNQQSKIFTRMFRADNAKKVRSGGSGLGLYVVRQIVDQVGWKIGFESKENEGTVFRVDIPGSGMAGRKGGAKLTRGVT